MLLSKPLEQVTIEDLRQLIDDEVQEGKTVDYKESMYRVDPLTKEERQTLDDEEKKKRQAERDKQIRELLKDVSSFANTVGGHLIVGMKEDNGVPTEVCGVEVDDPDKKKIQLDELIQQWLEPRISSTTRFMGLDSGRFVFVIRVLQSMTAPHRVTHHDFGHFFARNSGGAFRMDTSQLRTAFTLSETIFDRIKAFRRERVVQIKSGQGPIPLPSGAKMILHLVPIDAYVTSLSLDVGGLQQISHLASPFAEWDWHTRFNMDGLVIYGGGQLSQGKALHERSAYSQIFRNGVLEVVLNGIKYQMPDSESKTWCLRTRTIEPGLVGALPRYGEFFEQAGISPPIWCFLTLTGVEGVFVWHPDDNYERRPPIERSDLLLPDIQIDDLGADAADILRPLFDMIWNSAGWPRSLNFDEKGNWVGR